MGQLNIVGKTDSLTNRPSSVTPSIYPSLVALHHPSIPHVFGSFLLPFGLFKNDISLKKDGTLFPVERSNTNWQSLQFNRHPVFLSFFPLPPFSLPSPTLLTNEELWSEALTKSELMNYSNTYNVIIVINGPLTYLHTRFPKWTSRSGLMSLSLWHRFKASSVSQLSSTTYISPNALWDKKNLGLIFIFSS